MKINGSNHIHVNPYQKQMNKQASVSKGNASDKVEISNQAQQMLKGNEIQEARQKHVEQIKKEVQNGDYQINYQETAKKMIDFWSNRG
ncbi:negative regulator of flagellin synthesis FlgM [Salirhabdus euzebyi]|uniref:Negative regulator of flagellin synthesis n=1 Tax=Salirhabdus euzebyi TaxID=394506 RepID=A0A841Q5F6_9BACI|nr:flagellar biosynthesis anti-sigma factor FlgM [Salirhabdus euzebyi]MBB6453631.1 negative regulator of flagellin synthesis FlgM [Salirhabdus euzebyi]